MISKKQAQINLERWRQKNAANRIVVSTGNEPNGVELIALCVFGNIWDVFVGDGWKNHARVVVKSAPNSRAPWVLQGSVTSAAIFGNVLAARKAG